MAWQAEFSVIQRSGIGSANIFRLKKVNSTPSPIQGIYDAIQRMQTGKKTSPQGRKKKGYIRLASFVYVCMFPESSTTRQRKFLIVIATEKATCENTGTQVALDFDGLNSGLPVFGTCRGIVRMRSCDHASAHPPATALLQSFFTRSTHSPYSAVVYMSKLSS